MDQQYLETGEVVSTHAMRGEVKVLPWADGPDFLLQFKTLRVGGRDYEVERSRVQQTCVLLKLRGVDTVEQAMALRGKIVAFDRTGVQPEAGYFIADLLGLTVLEGGHEIGKIADVLQYPGNDVWVVRGEHEYLIPAVKEFITEVCPADGIVHVRLIEGMRTDEN
ncbi:MAG: ribosome maturation factor RimM [Oscillospiraceae bacterium]|nr:ribosome maturation factor RimM [Oscillospiraceae bacterium]